MTARSATYAQSGLLESRAKRHPVTTITFAAILKRISIASSTGRKVAIISLGTVIDFFRVAPYHNCCRWCSSRHSESALRYLHNTPEGCRSSCFLLHCWRCGMKGSQPSTALLGAGNQPPKRTHACIIYYKRTHNASSLSRVILISA